MNQRELHSNLQLAEMLKRIGKKARARVDEHPDPRGHEFPHDPTPQPVHHVERGK